MSGKVHESGQRRLAKLRGAAQGNLILTEELKREQAGGTERDDAERNGEQS